MPHTPMFITTYVGGGRVETLSISSTVVARFDDLPINYGTYIDLYDGVMRVLQSAYPHRSYDGLDQYAGPIVEELERRAIDGV